MKVYLLAILIACLFISCDSEPKKCYKEIDLATYNIYTAIDTLYYSPSVIVTECSDTIRFFKAALRLIKRINQNKSRYYLLDPSAYLENDSTIIWYAPPFKATSDSGQYFKNGIWLYAKFYTETTDSTLFHKESESGVKYVIDSMPGKIQSRTAPITEGIYFVRNDSLLKVSKEQSEDSFYSLGNDGFYFIPNPGLLFTRIPLSEIK